MKDSLGQIVFNVAAANINIRFNHFGVMTLAWDDFEYNFVAVPAWISPRPTPDQINEIRQFGGPVGYSLIKSNKKLHFWKDSLSSIGVEVS